MSGNNNGGGSGMTCRRIPLSINPELAGIVDPGVPGTKLNNTEGLVSLYYGESVVFCFTMIDASGNAVPYGAGDQFELVADSDFVHAEDPLMCYSGADKVNLAGDWSESSPAAGRFSVRLSCATIGFLQKLGTAKSIRTYLELRCVTDAAISILMRAEITANNVVMIDEGVPESADPEFYTAAQTDALLAGVAGAEPQIRYSVDGVNVAASATGALFWSFRLGDDGVWSAWLPIPQPDTPAGRIEAAFEVATASGGTAPETVELTYAALGVADPTDVSVFEVESAGTELDITKSASLQIRWNDTTEKLLLSWNGGWPDGDYLVRG